MKNQNISIKPIFLSVLIIDVLVVVGAFFLIENSLSALLVAAVALTGLLALWLVARQSLSAFSAVSLSINKDCDTAKILEATHSLFQYLDQELVGQFQNARHENSQVQEILADAVAKLVQSFTSLEKDTSRQLELALKLSGAESNDQQSGAGHKDISFAELFPSIEQVMDKLLNATIKSSEQSGQVVQSTRKTRKLFKGVLGILDEVKKIADQTNLLAINAAIEAARAGTAGKGFAVVAEEVRNLSTRSNRFSEQIDKLLQEISTSLADVETSVEKLAARSDQLVKEEQENIARVMRQAQEFYAVVNSCAQQISQLAESVSGQVGQAVTSMQFQDMATQIIGTVNNRLEAAATLLDDLVALPAAAEQREGPDADDQLAELMNLLNSGKLLVQQSHHNPVSQKSMDEGDIELF